MKEKHKKKLAFLRILPASIGALTGSILALSFFLLLQFAAKTSGGSPYILSNFLLFGITFLSALFSNVLGPVFLALFEGEKFHGYFRRALSEIFFCNAIILFLASPFFLYLSLDSAYSIAKFLLPFLALCSALLYETYARKTEPLFAVHTTIVSGVFISFSAFLLFPAVIPIEMMPFFFLPLAWLLIPFATLVVERLHAFFRFS